jgi:hypothetical protein
LNGGDLLSGVPAEIIGLAWGTLHPITFSLLHVGRFFIEAIKPHSILIKTLKHHISFDVMHGALNYSHNETKTIILYYFIDHFNLLAKMYLNMNNTKLY